MQDFYEHPDTSILYVPENILYEPSAEEQSCQEYETLKDLYNSVLTNSCHCPLDDCSDCNHGGNYVFTDANGRRELILSNTRKSKDLIYECFHLCICAPTCSNRLVQFGPRKMLKIIETPQKGKGLITTEPIPKGAFICEYAGELITKLEAERRIERNLAGSKNNYIICLNEFSNSNESEKSSIRSFQTFVDPSESGNIGRYINHSCNPNCEILSVRVDGPLPKLAIFAKRSIPAFEELTFHYGVGDNLTTLKNRKPCYCGSEGCLQVLPDLAF